MAGHSTDEVRIELRRGSVSIPGPSCDALVEHLGTLETTSELSEAFAAAATAERVRLTDPQKLALRNVINFWANQKGGSYDDLPAGMYELRNALQGDLLHVGAEASDD